MTDTQWFWKGKWLEYCSCDWGCPCESNAPPSRGHCDGVVALHIDEGHYGDVKLDGITIVATFFFPRALHHGGGHMQPILPDWTTPEQRDAVFKIMSGEGQPPQHHLRDLPSGRGDHPRAAVHQNRIRMGHRQAHRPHRHTGHRARAPSRSATP